MSGTPRVSIIVPSRTGQVDGLRTQLTRQSLRDWELIIQAGTAPAGRARNLGARRTAGRLLIFLDDDVVLGQMDLLERLSAALEARGPWAAMGAVWRVPPGANAFQQRYVREAFPPELPPADGREAVEVPWRTIGTACIAIPRATFQALDGFDDTLLSGEDYEFCYRLHRRGGRVYALTDAWVYHEPPRTLGEAARKTLWYERGNAQVARKHPAAGYRMPLRGPLHTVGYLALRTLALPLLCVVKVSYHHRRPQVAWRPGSALLSYLGAWAYCVGWHFPPRMAAQRPPQPSGALDPRPSVS